ncbi:hypothetical protein F4679DRAFT_538630 [Xylaria curta]|nr:hypothetical protein F4679DRAFT_538630 [Xylaria curta]
MSEAFWSTYCMHAAWVSLLQSLFFAALEPDDNSIFRISGPRDDIRSPVLLTFELGRGSCFRSLHHIPNPKGDASLKLRKGPCKPIDDRLLGISEEIVMAAAAA